MTLRALVVAPHPDDETLGCGGTLLRLAEGGATLGWLIVTDMTVAAGYDEQQRQVRTELVDRVADAYGFASVSQLRLPTTELEGIPVARLVGEIGEVYRSFEPEWVFLPHHGDAHSDHRVVARACAACSKWFRYPFIKRVMAYETLSETDQSLLDERDGFHPNLYFNITEQLPGKIDMLSFYGGECGEFPFPRSPEAVEALARLRGTQSGYYAAESFMLLREHND